MNKKLKTILVIIGAVLVLTFGYVSWKVLSPSTRYGDNSTLSGGLTVQLSNTGDTLTVGTTNPTVINQNGTAKFRGQVTQSSTLSTSTPASLTLQASDLAVSTILETPTVGAITLTLPATSTLTSLIPTAGDSVVINIVNASTTVSTATVVTLAGGTGMNVSVATGTAASTIAIPAKKVATITLIRLASTDVDLMMEPTI